MSKIKKVLFIGITLSVTFLAGCIPSSKNNTYTTKLDSKDPNKVLIFKSKGNNQQCDENVDGSCAPVISEPPTDNPPEEELAHKSSIKEYFDHSAIIGDSVAKHFSNYIYGKKASKLKGMFSLSAGSFSLVHALNDPTKAKVYPLYQGKKIPVEEALKNMKTEHCFMFFGINDLGNGGVEKVVNRYKKLINRIEKANPDIDIHIISTTALHKSVEGKYKNLNNKNIDKLNKILKKYAKDKDNIVYVDIASKLKDKSGNLADEYCNDKFCHQTPKAFKLWEKALIKSAIDGMKAQGIEITDLGKEKSSASKEKVEKDKTEDNQTNTNADNQGN